MIDVTADISKLLGPARHQGRRPTCMAFTVSDLNAFSNSVGHLSVDYLCHHAAKAIAGWMPANGFTVDAVLGAAQQPGQPVELAYPYSGDDLAVPLTKPSQSISPLYCSPTSSRHLTVDELFASVASGRPAGLVVAVAESLFRPTNGVIAFDPMVLPGEYHAMVAVGSGAHVATGEPHLFVRNSWGGSWGLDGHAWLPRSYLELHLVEGLAY